MEEAVIVASVRSPLGKAKKGSFIHTRIDDIAAQVLEEALKKVPQLDTKLIEDVLIGCAMPEGEQGLNVARNISFLVGLPFGLGALTINRYCSSSPNIYVFASILVPSKSKWNVPHSRPNFCIASISLALLLFSLAQ